MFVKDSKVTESEQEPDVGGLTGDQLQRIILFSDMH